MASGKGKKKNTVRIVRKDLLRLCRENYRMGEQITELQTRNNELAAEVSMLKAQYLSASSLTDDVR